MGSRTYDPNRDFAYLFPAIIETLRDRVLGSPPKWREFWDVAASLGVTRAEVEEGVEAAIRFAVYAVDDPKASMAMHLNRCGWFQLSPATRVLVSAAIGQPCLSMFFTGARCATINGTGPCDSLSAMKASPDEFSLVRPPQVGGFAKWRRWFAAVWAAVKGA